MKKIIHFLVTVFLASISTRVSSQAGAPVTNFSATPYDVCPGEPVQYTDLSLNSPTVWNWTFKGGNPATSTLQNPVVVYNLPGKYDVILTASNSNGILTKGELSMIKVMVCSGINEHNDYFNLQIFPNPAQSSVNITARIDARYTLYNTIGSVMLKGSIAKDEITNVALGNLPAGIYFFSLSNGTSSKSYKFVKE